MKILIAILLIFSCINANDLEIKDYYLKDNTNVLELQDILEKESLFKPIDAHNFGIFNNTIWTKITLKNRTSKLVEKRVYNKSPVIDYIDVYVLKDKKLLKTYKLGDKVEHKNRDNIFRVNYFDIRVKPFEELRVFIKQKTAPPMNIKWNFTNKEYFSKHYNIERTIYLIFVGIFIFPLIISFILYIVLKDEAYLVYSAFTFCSIIYQLIRCGFIYELNLQNIFNDTVFYIVSNAMVILFVLFPLIFFKFQKNEYKILLFILKFLMLALLTYMIFYLTGIIKEHSDYTVIIYLMLFITPLILSIRVFFTKRVGSVFYLLANIVVFSSTTYSLASLAGLIEEVGSFDYYLNTIAVSIQDLLLGIMIVQATLFLKKTHDKNQELINEYSKLSFIGQTMINISHQWKTPINAIYNSINHIEVAREFQDKDIDLIINKNLKDIKETTEYLNHTALSHLDFYKSKITKEKINLYDELSFLIKLVQNEFSKKSIDIKLNFNQNITLSIQKNYFLNVMMILFENSYKIFKQRNIKSPVISIEVLKDDNSFILKFNDNAQGTKDDTSTLFDKDYSMSDSTGLGLYIAKEIVLSKLEGDISAQNTKEGICFTLSINLTK